MEQTNTGQANSAETSFTAGKYLTFRIAERAFGVPVSHVREINRMCAITPVPHTPKFVAGVINLRGKVIPVVDLRRKLGFEAAAETKNTCIVVIDGSFGQVGVIVDAVSSVVDVASEQIEPAPSLGTNPALAHIKSVGKLGDEIVLLLDIMSALSREEFVRLATGSPRAA